MPCRGLVLLVGPAAVRAGGRRPAREIATRELRSEWSISRPALALPPPTGTAARPSGPSGALHTGGACVVWTSPARHRRPRAPQPGPPVPPAPSTPAVLCCCAWLGVSPRSPAWPRRCPSSFARNSLATISNIEFRSLQLQRFQTLLKFLPIELCARFLWSCPCRPSNVACNSLTALSNYEFRLLELQRF